MALNWICNNNNNDSKTEDNSKYIQIKSIFKKDIFFRGYKYIWILEKKNYFGIEEYEVKKWDSGNNIII